jgi:starch phosphorylase
MRESMAQLTPRFSASRAVREYTEEHYLPAAAEYRARAADKGAVGRQIVDWQHSLDEKWAALHLGEVKVETRDDQLAFELEVWLGDLDPHSVRIELYADGLGGGAPVRHEMKRGRQQAGTAGSFVYGVDVSAGRSPADYTPRVIPHRAGVSIPLEDSRIRWQR